jgi:hypothetical protein
MTALEQLLREAMTSHTDDVPALRPGAARQALRHSRRSRTMGVAAIGTATVAVTVGVGALAATWQPSSTAGSAGAAPASKPAADTPATAPTSAAVVTSTTVAAVPSAMVVTGTEVVNKYGPAPAILASVTLPDPAPGFPLRREQDSTEPATFDTDKALWTKAFLVGQADAGGPEATVMVIDGSTGFQRNPASPSPAVTTVSVGGRPGQVYLSGTDHDVYFTAVNLTVLVAGDQGATTDEMVALANALQGLPH